jgi:hypothetical protein
MGVKISDLTSLATSTFADDDILEIEQYVSVGGVSDKEDDRSSDQRGSQDICLDSH